MEGHQTLKNTKGGDYGRKEGGEEGFEKRGSER
jgi:hypothetical protein